MSWVLDAEIYLDAMGLGDAIKDKNKASIQDCAKALIFLRHHLDEGLKIEYLTVKDPLILWNSLKERYDNLKLVTLSQARYDWAHLRLQDFKSISEYNSAMFRITSKLKLCGDSITHYDMLEKTFIEFHTSNMVLQQQYREKGFKKYSELISLLLMAERNDLLMRNHENRPTGSTPLPEVNEVYSHYAKCGKGRGPIRGRGCGRGQGRNFLGINHPPKKNNHQKWKGKDKKPKANGSETEYYRYGGKGHWANICRTPRYLAEHYQASLKNKGHEANFV
ncbi:uncharacterized protein [Nicotiana tomentosiformis]|uniref:uncharacterized protein n=1 Tax=Nicotiana tomentosiformis TaxID=4098 RepID=UPI00388C5E17